MAARDGRERSTMEGAGQRGAGPHMNAAPTADRARQTLSRSKTSTGRDQYIIPLDTQVHVVAASHYG
jgi:hypothetical protein